MYRISASQVKTWRQCNRKYCFEYIEKDKSPPSAAQQFGTNVHSILETYLRKGLPPDLKTVPGRVANQGLQWLPNPVPELVVERKLEMPWVKDKAQMIGYIDCLVPPGIMFADRPMVIDHKTTSDLRWAQSVEELEKDPQGLIYAAYAMSHFKVSEVVARWVYYASTNPKSGNRKPKGSKPVETVFSLNDEKFCMRINKMDADIRLMIAARDNKVKGLDAAPNASSCSAYGGCYHKPKCNLSGGDVLAGYLDKF